MKPRIILALGNVKAPPDAIVIDLKNGTFWIDGQKFARHKCSPNSSRFKIISTVLIAGLIDRIDLADAVFGDREDGGPDDLLNYFGSTFGLTKPLQRWLGVKIVGSNRRYEVLWSPRPAMARAA